MKICKYCVSVDTRPGLKIDNGGICFPCRIQKQIINWDLRREELNTIVQDLKNQNKENGYDCIVSVSGGKDSTRQSLIVRDELGLKPLLVCCAYPPEQQTETGVQNLENLIKLGFDCISVTPSPKKYKKLMISMATFIYNPHSS